MRKRALRGCLIAVTLIVSGFAFAKSNRPTPTPSELPARNQKEAEPNTSDACQKKCSSADGPVSVKIFPSEKSESDIRKEEYEANEKPGLDRGLTNYTFWLAVFTAALFAAAFGQVWLFWWQLRLIRDSLDDAKIAAEAARDGALTAKESADIAKLSMVSGDRAYVHFAGCRWISHLKDKNAVAEKMDQPLRCRWVSDRVDRKAQIFWRVRPIWINSGNTPTRKLHVYVHYELLDAPLDADYQFIPTRDEPWPAMIAPKGQIEGASRDFFGDDLVAVKEGRKHLYVWGIARYQDVFPDTVVRVTKFCVVATNLTGDPTKPWDEKFPFHIAFVIFNRHNCADEDCDEET